MLPDFGEKRSGEAASETWKQSNENLPVDGPTKCAHLGLEITYRGEDPLSSLQQFETLVGRMSASSIASKELASDLVF